MKLTKPQEALLSTLREGWQLALSQGFNGGARIQKGKRGCGGECRTVNCRTAHALIDAGIVVKAANSNWCETIYDAAPVREVQP